MRILSTIGKLSGRGSVVSGRCVVRGLRRSRSLMETCEGRVLMSAAPTVSAPSPASSPTPVPPASIHVGVGNTNNLQVVTTGEPNSAAVVSLSMSHNYNSGGPDLKISANGMSVTVPVNFSSIAVNDSTNGVVFFNANDTALVSDNNVPYVNITTNGAVALTSVVPITATGNYVYEGDTGFYNARPNLTGHIVTSIPGGADLVANSPDSVLTSYGPISSTFFANGYRGVTIHDAQASSTAYVSASDTVYMGGGNDQVYVNSYSNKISATWIDTGTGNDLVDVYGDGNAAITVISPQGGAYVRQFTHVLDLTVISSGGSTSTLDRDFSLRSDLNFWVLNTNVSYTMLNGDNGGGKG